MDAWSICPKETTGEVATGSAPDPRCGRIFFIISSRRMLNQSKIM
jgi:hypothetical protein